MVTEFGATDNVENIAEVMGKADLHKICWLYWAYTGNDKTSQSRNAQALVYDPARRRPAATSERQWRRNRFGAQRARADRGGSCRRRTRRCRRDPLTPAPPGG